MNDQSIFIIVALLPLAAVMLTVQVNPYHALVIRGILGAVAALVYAVLGAPDVALTEALVGTMLAITLYAVAVRSSLVMRFGVLQESLEKIEKPAESDHSCERLTTLITALRTIASKHYLRLELVPYADPGALQQALLDKDIHATCVARSQTMTSNKETEEIRQPYHTVTRIRRLHEILQAELSSSLTSLAYTTTLDLGEKP
jgi:putative multicomponent Na+:H+ antiporter subunit B